MKTTLGFALIEVLFSMLFISLVLFSLLEYQIQTLDLIKQSELKTIATIQLANFSDMLLVAKTDSQQKKYFKIWKKQNRHLLPNAKSTFDSVDDYFCRISVQWMFRKIQSQSAVVFCAS